MNHFVSRSLRFLDAEESRCIPATDLLADEQFRGRSIIILGEPGSGKSHLIADLAGIQEWHQKPISAQRLTRDPGAISQGADLVFVDGLDEVASLNEGDALHDVLAALNKRGARRFVIACRAAEWRSDAARSVFKDWGPDEPLEVFIEPFTDEQANHFLVDVVELDIQSATKIVDHYRDRGVGEWLGNPLTLKMLGKSSTDAQLPSSAEQLFHQFVEHSWGEWRKQGTHHDSLTLNTCVDGLGALFGSLILSGKAAISLAPVAQLQPGDLHISDSWSLPGLKSLSEKHLKALLDNRLVSALGNDRFTYMHRRIGEFLGARWLARHADTGRKRRRLISLLQSAGGIVPASLRGLFGWLARDPHLANDIIRLDPLAVIIYGDADQLAPPHAALLLEHLQEISRRNPWFRTSDRLNARSLVQAGLEQRAAQILADASQALALRLTIVEQLRDAGDLSAFRPLLDQWLTDESVPWRLRDEAADILLARADDVDWARILATLAGQTGADSKRLALAISAEREGRDFDDAALASLVFDRHATAPDEIGKFWRLERAIPEERLDGLLDALVAEASRRLTDESGSEIWDLQRLMVGLIVRRIKLLADLDASLLWRWVSCFPEHSRTASRDDELANALADREELRRAVQRHVLIDSGADLSFVRPLFELQDRLPGASLNDADIVYHLNALPDGDGRWWDLVRWARHDAERGSEVREAARRHATAAEDRAKLQELSTPRKQAWEITEEQREQARQAERGARWQKHRESFTEHRQRLLSGDWAALVGPADVYVGWATEEIDDLPPHDRIETWLGPELAADVFAGFKAWLGRSSAELTPSQVAETYTEGQRMRAGSILIAALYERYRTGSDFKDLDDDRILAGMLEFELGLYRDEAVKELGDKLEQELRVRGLYEDYSRALLEPQLRAGKDYPTGLYDLMREAKNAEVGARLAAEWLKSMPDLYARAEEELIDCLLRAGCAGVLKEVSNERLTLSGLAIERRRNWQAVALIVDFDAGVANFGNELSRDRSSLWVLRARLGGRRRSEEESAGKNPKLFAWIVSTFRQHWRNVAWPAGVSSGVTNPWDASEFLGGLINSLAADTSDAAAQELRTLASIQDGYHDKIRAALAAQADRRAELEFRPFEPVEIAAVLADASPRTPKDLQAVVLEALDEVQRRIHANQTDSWRRFYKDPDMRVPYDEDACSDYLAELLAAADPSVGFQRETHLAGNRETDIWCSVDAVSIPIEAKGQWHPQIWTAPDEQLASQQATDHRADGYGIYLVYWFGEAGKALTRPPNDRGIDQAPSAPGELERLLEAASPALRSGRLRVKVLDLSRLA